MAAHKKGESKKKKSKKKTDLKANKTCFTKFSTAWQKPKDFFSLSNIQLVVSLFFIMKQFFACVP
jgi:hypothetical protein